MKKTILTILLLAFCVSISGAGITDQMRRVIAAKNAGGASGASFSDLFNRSSSDSLGANWTETVGDADIINDTQMVLTSDGWNVAVIIYSGTSTTTNNQYVGFDFVGTYGESRQAEVILRYVNETTNYYALVFVGTDPCRWSWHNVDPEAVSTPTQIATNDMESCADGDSYHVTITGTGANTDIRIWKNQTSNTPISATEWDSADTTPDASFTTTDPGVNAVDSGSKVGVMTESFFADSFILDNFFGGDIP